MNATERAVLDREPVPIDVSGQPASCMVIRREGQWRTAWGMNGCRRPEPFGPAYPSARAAAQASRYVNERMFGKAVS